MHWRRASLVIAPGLLASGCSQPSETLVEVETAELAAGETASAPDAGPAKGDAQQTEAVPERLLGTSVYSHEECEPDSEMTPDRRKIVASISFAAGRTYMLDVEGFHFEGSYRYAGGENARFTLDNAVNFNVEGDTLQNWCEGDAVYQCGRVFVRGGQ